MNKQLVYNKLFNKPTELKSKKVNLSLKEDYESKKEEFLELNEKANEIFIQLENLKNEFQQIDTDWYTSFNEQNEMADDIMSQMSDLGLDIGEMFDENLRITNLYYDGNFTTENLKYLRS